MNSDFPFSLEKATDVSTLFLRLEGGTINIMKLIKLCYLLDRESIRTRFTPVIGGHYYSMKNGPVPGHVLSAVNGDYSRSDNVWESKIGDRSDHQVQLLDNSGSCDNLSPSEVKLLNEVYERWGAFDQWELSDWCHAHCGEWSKVSGGRKDIFLTDIARNVGVDERAVEEAADAAEFLNAILN